MSLSDCIMCWNTPCSCGYEYRFQHKNQRIEKASVILGINYYELEQILKDIIPNDHPKLSNLSWSNK
ncbi:hypothetical protein [Flavobacterium sp.]|uniref:hypothetical protein n=1 Tax=Flavobacterium sp. TaxID=239 RepID=UPI00260FCDE6|nr:hypothetical protein [Flavobacterium sp.]